MQRGKRLTATGTGAVTVCWRDSLRWALGSLLGALGQPGSAARRALFLLLSIAYLLGVGLVRCGADILSLS